MLFVSIFWFPIPVILLLQHIQEQSHVAYYQSQKYIGKFYACIRVIIGIIKALLIAASINRWVLVCALIHLAYLSHSILIRLQVILLLAKQLEAVVSHKDKTYLTHDVNDDDRLERGWTSKAAAEAGNDQGSYQN